MKRRILAAGLAGLAGLAGCGLEAMRPEAVMDAASHGIVADGSTLNTSAIQAAIDSLSNSGGGVLAFGAGNYVTGTIQLKDNVRLRFAEGAVLLGSHNPADYRNLDPFIDGSNKPRGYAMLTAIGAKNVGIEGAGTIDGQGKALKAAQPDFIVRPFLIRWEHCTNVTVKDIHLTDPGAWTMQFFQCNNIVADHVTVRSAASHLPNNDGIDIDSCEKANISDCDIESGDDAICVKATSPQPSRDLTISGCTLQTRCNGIKLGTESLGDFLNIQASHCRMSQIGMAGIALYSVDGAHLENVSLSDIDMDGVSVPISIRLGARLKTFRPGDTARPVGTIRNINIENVHAINAKQIGILVNGIPGHDVESIHLKNIDISLPGGGTSQDAAVELAENEATYPEYSMFGKVMPVYGVYLRHVKDFVGDNVKTSVKLPDVRKETALIDVEGFPAGR